MGRSLAMLLAALVGLTLALSFAAAALLTRNPLWLSDVAAAAGLPRGVALVAAALILLAAAPLGAAALVRLLGRLTRAWTPRGLAAGVLAGGCVVLLSIAPPFTGEVLGAPGMPWAAQRFAEERRMVILLASAAANLCLYTAVGLIIGLAGGLARLRPDALEAPPPRWPAAALPLALGGVWACCVAAAWNSESSMRWRCMLAGHDLLRGVHLHRAQAAAAGGPLFDWCAPDRPIDAPAVLCVHGGGWVGGRPDDMLPIAVELARRGLFAATVRYRLAPEHPHPAQIDDIRAGARWFGQQLAERGRPTEVALLGWSAGGHLAALAAVHDDRWERHVDDVSYLPTKPTEVAMAVVWSAPSNLAGADRERYNSHVLVDWANLANLKGMFIYQSISPTSFIDRQDPPMLILHGADDRVVMPWQAKELATRLDAAGIPHRLIITPGQGHRWQGAALLEAIDASVAFLTDRSSSQRREARATEGGD